MDDGRNHAPPAPVLLDTEDDLLNALDLDSVAVALSDKEKLALQLYRQVRELELERSLLEAQQHATTSAVSDEHLSDEHLSDDEVAQQLIDAERAAMEARASYLLRNKITDQVLITDPVIKAVHGSSYASFEERRLAPLLGPRDALSMHLSHLTHQLTTASASLASTSKAVAAANSKNAALASTLLSLVDPGPSSSSLSSAAEALAASDPKLRDQLLNTERDAARARRRRRCIKGLVAGIVVSSGVDWAGDERLRELVLEEDDEEEDDDDGDDEVEGGESELI